MRSFARGNSGFPVQCDYRSAPNPNKNTESPKDGKIRALSSYFGSQLFGRRYLLGPELWRNAEHTFNWAFPPTDSQSLTDCLPSRSDRQNQGHDTRETLNSPFYQCSSEYPCYLRAINSAPCHGRGTTLRHNHI